MKLPEAFQEKMRGLLGEEYSQYSKGFEKGYGQTLRVNQLKTEPAEILRRFPVKPVSWCETGFYYEGEDRLSLHPYYYGGVYYLQEPSAMAPAAFLPVKPGDRVLDLCAAPGGKTTALAGKLRGKGVLIANDISISRCKALLKNMEMAGVKNAMVTCESPEKLHRYFRGYFDCILVDAPCSGEGMFRREPSMAADWSPEEVERYSSIQKEILSLAADMLRPGGYLLYSTCTYSPEENEQVVETLLQGEKGFRVVEIPECTEEFCRKNGVDQGHPEWSVTKEEQLKHCRRFWNHRVRGEGQFAALLQKNSEELERESRDEEKAEYFAQPPQRKKDRQLEKGGKRFKGKRKNGMDGEMDREAMYRFLKECGLECPKERIQCIEERAFLLPEGLPPMEGLRIVRSGLYLGDCKKNRFVPGQALAMALKPEEYARSISLSPEDERVEKYLRGETIEAESEDGFVLVCVDGYPLGWAKASRGTLKNKYTPGWRKQ